MYKTLQIAIYDLRVYLADRGNLIALILLPVVLILAIGFALGGAGGPTTLRVDIIDNDNSLESAAFIDALREGNDTLILCPLDAQGEDAANCRLDELEGYTDGDALTLAQGQERVNGDVSAALIVIPQGYANQVENYAPVTIDYYSEGDITQTQGVDPVLQTVQSVLQRINGELVAAQTGNAIAATLEIDDPAFTDAVTGGAEAAWRDTPVTVQLETTGEGIRTEGELPTGFNQSVPGMGTMFVLFTVLSGMPLLLRERKQWTLQRLAVMPVTKWQILGGKILARFGTGLLQFAIIVVLGVLLGVDFLNNIVGAALVIIAFTLAATALTFAIAPLMKDEFQAGTMVTFLGLPLAALGGAWWPLEVAPDFMQTIGRISPIAWAMDGFNEVLFYGGGLAEIIVPVVVLLGMAAVLFVIGVMNFEIER